MFPELPLEPESYAAEWFLDTRAIAGEIELLPHQPPHGQIFGEPDGVAGRIRNFPQDIEIGSLLGRLQRGHDAVLGDATLSVWFLGQTAVFARWAVVGLGVAQVPDQRYEKVRFQVTGLDALLATNPIKHVTWPEFASAWSGGEAGFCAHLNELAVWESEADATKVTCDYALRFSFADAFHFELTFAPIVTMQSATPLTVDEWAEAWLNPLVRLTTFATRAPRELAWVTLHNAAPQAEQGAPRNDVTGQLFGGGIAQEPYAAKNPREEFIRWRERPILTLERLGRPLAQLVRRWHELDAEQSVFLELVRLALFDPDLPERARLLYLIQALEALHASEHVADDTQAQAIYERRRTEALARLDALKPELEHLRPDGSIESDTRFLRRSLPRRKLDSLDRRLGELVEAAPLALRARLDQLKESELGRSLTESGELTIIGQLRQLRNDLSHGNRNPSAEELRPWADAVEDLCRAHVLRLLGLDPSEVERALDPSAVQGSDGASTTGDG